MMKPSAVKISVVQRGDDGGESIIVTPVWEGVDRPESSSYSVGPNTPAKMKLAHRFAAAFESGKLTQDAVKKIDVCGNTYISYSKTLYMRQLHSELKRIGF